MENLVPVSIWKSNNRRQNIVEKRRNCFNFRYISNFRSHITYAFVKCICYIYLFLNFGNLTCRGAHISKLLRESFWLRDIESRLYMSKAITRMLFSCMQTMKMQVNLSIAAVWDGSSLLSYRIFRSCTYKHVVLDWPQSPVTKYLFL